jgi:hypothetical protein
VSSGHLVVAAAPRLGSPAAVMAGPSSAVCFVAGAAQRLAAVVADPSAVCCGMVLVVVAAAPKLGLLLCWLGHLLCAWAWSW